MSFWPIDFLWDSCFGQLLIPLGYACYPVMLLSCSFFSKSLSISCGCENMISSPFCCCIFLLCQNRNSVLRVLCFPNSVLVSVISFCTRLVLSFSFFSCQRRCSQSIILGDHQDMRLLKKCFDSWNFLFDVSSPEWLGIWFLFVLVWPFHVDLHALTLLCVCLVFVQEMREKNKKVAWLFFTLYLIWWQQLPMLQTCFFFFFIFSQRLPFDEE